MKNLFSYFALCLSALILVLFLEARVRASEASADQLKYDEIFVRGSINFSPDRRYFTAETQARLHVELYEFKTGAVVHEYRHKETIPTCFFSADGKYLITSSDDGELKLIDVINAKEVTSILFDSEYSSQWFSPQSRYLLVDDLDGELAIYHTATGQLIKMIRYASGSYQSCLVRSVTFFADGTRAYVRSEIFDGRQSVYTAREIRLSDGQILHHLRDRGALNHCTMSSSGKYLTLLSINIKGRKSKKHIRLYETQNMKKMKTFAFKHDVAMDSFSEHEGHLKVKLDNGDIVLLHLSTERRRTYQSKRDVSLDSIKFSPDEKSFVMKHDSDFYAFYHEGKRVAMLETSDYSPKFIFSPDSKFLLFYNENKMLQLYDARTGKLLRESVANKCYGSTPDSRYYAFSPDSRYFAFTVDRSEPHDEDFSDAERPDSQTSVELIRTADLKHVNSALFQGRIYQLFFTPDSKLLITQSNNILRSTYLP